MLALHRTTFFDNHLWSIFQSSITHSFFTDYNIHDRPLWADLVYCSNPFYSELLIISFARIWTLDLLVASRSDNHWAMTTWFDNRVRNNPIFLCKMFELRTLNSNKASKLPLSACLKAPKSILQQKDKIVSISLYHCNIQPSLLPQKPRLQVPKWTLRNA